MADQIPPQYPIGSIPPPQKGGSGMAIASLILGIISLVLFCVIYVSIPAAILAIIFGVLARNKAAAGLAEGRSMATTGMVCGIIAITLATIAFAGCLAILGIAGKNAPALQEIQKEMQRQMEQQRQQTRPSTVPSAMIDPLLQYARAYLT